MTLLRSSATANASSSTFRARGLRPNTSTSGVAEARATFPAADGEAEGEPEEEEEAPYPLPEVSKSKWRIFSVDLSHPSKSPPWNCTSQRYRVKPGGTIGAPGTCCCAAIGWARIEPSSSPLPFAPAAATLAISVVPTAAGAK